MKKLSFTAVAVAAIIGTALLCTACPMDGQKAAEQFFTGSYGTYVWAANDLTLSSNEFQRALRRIGRTQRYA